jgi:predicted RNase H-like HicB family nuclease
MSLVKDKILHLPILIEQDEDNIYIVSCPVFKGCHSFGKTIEEALQNIREVVEMCLEEDKENLSEINRFVGFREMEIKYSSASSV